MNIKFSKPKLGDIRFLAFQDWDRKNFWIQKVEITKIGRTWYKGKIIKDILGTAPKSHETGEYPYHCFLETELDAKKAVIYNTFNDGGDTPLFFRDSPNL